jgi:hypothetical protein
MSPTGDDRRRAVTLRVVVDGEARWRRGHSEVTAVLDEELGQKTPASAGLRESTNAVDRL